MPLFLSRATPHDAARISEIHMAAFSTNGMLLAQFPTPAVRAGLKRSIEKKALADINDPKTSVLVVRELETTDMDVGVDDGGPDVVSRGKVISFAKWGHPVEEGEDYLEPEWEWPEGTERDILERWTKVVDDAQEKVLGREPSYRLTFIATDPQYERRGAASLMVQWGVEQCKRFNIPAYLESTMEACFLYEKSGFIPAEKLSLTFKEKSENGELKFYEEISYLFRPQ